MGPKTFLFHVVAVPGPTVNIYGTDVSAARDNEQILIKLAKYFSPQVYESIFSGDLKFKIQTKRKRLTVFFSDIKDSVKSPTTGTGSPHRTHHRIPHHHDQYCRSSRGHRGQIYRRRHHGVFEVEIRGHKQDAIACVEMALETKSALARFGKPGKPKGSHNPSISESESRNLYGGKLRFPRPFGLHHIGNGVDLASRLESNSRPNQILAEDTHLLIRDQIICKAR